MLREWAKGLIKSGRLGHSHEVWCPKKSRKHLPDGTYEAQAIEFAGGALIYRNHPDPMNATRNMQTAYKNCNVLELSMKHMDENKDDLIFASSQFPAKRKYQQDDLIVANETQEFIRRSDEEIQQKVESGFHKPDTQTTEQPVPQVPKVKCGNCSHEFETMDVGELSCSEWSLSRK